MKLLILTTTYDHHDKIWKQICELGFVFESVGTEYNCVLGLELYRTFRPNLVIFNSAMSSIPFLEYIELCRSYYSGAKFLIISPFAYPQDMPYSDAVIGYMTLDQIYSRTFELLLKKAQLMLSGLRQDTALPSSKHICRYLIPRPLVTLETVSKDYFVGELKALLDQYCVYELQYTGRYLQIKIISGCDTDIALDSLLQEAQNMCRQNFNTHVTFLLLDPTPELADQAAARKALIDQAYEWCYFCSGQKLIRVLDFKPKIRQVSQDIPALAEDIYYAVLNCQNDIHKILWTYYKANLKDTYDILSCGKVHGALATLFLSLSALCGSSDESLFEPCNSMEEECRCIADRFSYLAQYRASLLQQVNPILSRALLCVSAHYLDGISLRQTAEACNSSETYISYLFKNRFLYKFSDYINHIRIQTSLLLLQLSPNARASTVALASGFSDYHYFSQIFKRMTGKTVSEFKASQQGWREESH